jgi:sodium/proline symporter
VGWQLLELAETTTVHPMAAGILASSATMVVVSLATAKVAPVSPHILAAMNEAARVGPIPSELGSGRGRFDRDTGRA